MATRSPTLSSAIVHAWQNERSAVAIKRLALLFDRVYYIHPTYATFKGGPQDFLNRRREVAPGGPSWIENFSWWDDVVSQSAVDIHQSRRGSIGELITDFEKAEILVPAAFGPGAAFSQLPDDTFFRARTVWMQQELGDDVFLSATNTNKNWQNDPIVHGQMTLRNSVGHEIQQIWVNPPAAWNTSEALTDISYLAASLNAIPTFFEPSHIAGLKRRFAKVSELINENDQIPKNLGCASETQMRNTVAGHLLFTLGGQLFDDDTLRRVSTAEIIHLRKTMLSARRDLLDECLSAIDRIVAEGNGLESVDQEIQAYVRDTLRPALRDFREESQHAKDNLLGDMFVRSVQAACEFSVGALAGSFAAVAFTSSLWSLFLAGGFAAASRTLPSLTRDLKDAYVAQQARQRQGLALVDAVRNLRKQES